ncbi:unnamed protein product [Sphenostylis stenocarpa]|uniref:Uncharacterized protein n=1 Tax=Sphenostylis stenocarpa TaxID=92480 RepID=A0AA86VF41_9FABA|nr:unnamed protein product [Sphenostylis stenocarpa]
MARPTTMLLLLMLLLASLSSCLEARKLVLQNHHNKVNPSSRRDSTLYLSALPKGTVPPSSPSKKGHAVEVDEKLIARHLITIDRVLLRSVPSPVFLLWALESDYLLPHPTTLSLSFSLDQIKIILTPPPPPPPCCPIHMWVPNAYGPVMPFWLPSTHTSPTRLPIAIDSEALDSLLPPIAPLAHHQSCTQPSLS